MAYMSEEGYKNLVAELKELETVQRPKISAAIAEARDKGDLSENAEYDAAKEAQGLLEMKINQLKAVISDAKIIDTSKLKTDSVQILSHVELKNVKTGMKMAYTIVSESEANLKEGKISVNTPIAQGLLGKKIGEVADITIPQGEISLEILNISFDAQEPPPTGTHPTEAALLFDNDIHPNPKTKRNIMASIFSRIVAGEIPSYKVAEDERFYAFLDINPLAKGHTLVIPKREVDYIFDLTDDELAGIHLFARRVALAIRRAFPCRKVGEAVIGLEVPHAHIHLIPMQKESDMLFSNPKLRLSPEEFAAVAEAIRREWEAAGK